jgi:hypothetical protein
MVISRIIGGLGNQMFQYAAGRALALSKSVELRLDLSAFTGHTPHNGFELERVFNVSAQAASGADFRRVLGWRATPTFLRALRRKQLSWLRGSKVVVEPSFNYWPSILDLPDDCYLQGFWQSEKYFLHHAPMIRADYTFKQPLESRNKELVRSINQCHAVSLHVRRGDYAVNSATLATHGLCSSDYYHQAIRYIADRVTQPVFFVFSDDVPWVRDNISIEFPSHYVEHNRGGQSYIDMRLMMLCDHHVIANSSFSWWGAWLNPKPEKIVVAPKKWFAIGNNLMDLFPPGWVSL